ncbi:MAG TPA: hypothetical protein VFS21_35465 [Roseiflexaceae bacterium]|nr:hypothetical protein [Roseiflexaceae bacterium]
MTTDPNDIRIAALLAEIPEAERAHFDRYYQERLRDAAGDAARTAGALGIDQDQIERDLLEVLEREAEGRDDPDGLGMVPTADGESYLVPPDADPRQAPAQGRAAGGGSTTATTPPAGTLSRGRLVAGLAVLLLPLIWFGISLAGALGGDDTVLEPATVPTGVAETTPTPLAELDADDETLVWYPASLELPGGTVYRIATSAGQLGGTWEPEVGPGVAAWLSDTFINTVICLPPSAGAAELEPGEQLQVRTASGTLRRYAVVRVRSVERQQVEVLDQRRAGLTLIICGAGGNTRTAIEAVHRPELPAGAGLADAAGAQELPGRAAVAVVAVALTTPTTPLPAGEQAIQITAQITNTSGAPLALADLAPQLRVTGQVAEALPVAGGELAPEAAQAATWRYRVPAAGGSATWRVLDIAGGSVSFPVEIPAAPQPTLRATLAPADVRLEGGQLRLTLRLTATGGPAQLTPADVGLLAGDQPLALDPASTPLPLTVDPAAPAMLELAWTLPASTRTLELRCATQRWRISLPVSP